MTEQEARQRIDECEKKITASYKELRDSAKKMSDDVVQAFSGSGKKSKILPVIVLILIAAILCVAGPVIWIVGVLIAAGIILILVRKGNKLGQKEIIEAQNKLFVRIDGHPKTIGKGKK